MKAACETLGGCRDSLVFSSRLSSSMGVLTTVRFRQRLSD
jgi:hypothetical protein